MDHSVSFAYVICVVLNWSMMKWNKWSQNELTVPIQTQASLTLPVFNSLDSCLHWDRGETHQAAFVEQWSQIYSSPWEDLRTITSASPGQNVKLCCQTILCLVRHLGHLISNENKLNKKENPCKRSELLQTCYVFVKCSYRPVMSIKIQTQ